jgi:hypothetical protein
MRIEGIETTPEGWSGISWTDFMHYGKVIRTSKLTDKDLDDNNDLAFRMSEHKDQDVTIQYKGSADDNHRSTNSHDVMGYYSLDSDGNIVGDAHVLMDTNGNIFGQGGINSEAVIPAVSGEIAFFIIPDGVNNPNIVDAINNGDTVHLNDTDNDGGVNNITFENSSGEQTAQVQNMKFTHNEQNEDGQDYVVAEEVKNFDSVSWGTRKQVNIGFDNDGDGDHDDFVFRIKDIHDTQGQYESIDLSDGDDGDIINFDDDVRTSEHWVQKYHIEGDEKVVDIVTKTIDEQEYEFVEYVQPNHYRDLDPVHVFVETNIHTDF